MHSLGLSANLRPGRFNLEVSWPLNPAKQVYSGVVAWFNRRHTQWALSKLDNHMLLDIGLDPSESSIDRRKLYAHEIRHPML